MSNENPDGRFQTLSSAKMSMHPIQKNILKDKRTDLQKLKDVLKEIDENYAEEKRDYATTIYINNCWIVFRKDGTHIK